MRHWPPSQRRCSCSSARTAFFAEIAGRLGERLGVEVATTPGMHDAYSEYPEEFAAAMRSFLRKVSG
jgi:hypothetical protein